MPPDSADRAATGLAGAFLLYWLWATALCLLCAGLVLACGAYQAGWAVHSAGTRSLRSLVRACLCVLACALALAYGCALLRLCVLGLAYVLTL